MHVEVCSRADALDEYVPVEAGQHLKSDSVALLRVVNRHDALFPQQYGFLSGEVVGRRAGPRDAHHLTAHGLRSGPASTAAKRGSPLSAMAEQGRWSPNSPVVYGYVRAS